MNFLSRVNLFQPRIQSLDSKYSIFPFFESTAQIRHKSLIDGTFNSAWSGLHPDLALVVVLSFFVHFFHVHSSWFGSL